MTQTPGPEPDSSPRRWRRAGLVGLAVVALGGGGAALASWLFAQEQLSPLLERELSETLQRPVELGELEGITFSKIRFGPSQIPATEEHPDTLALEAVEVRFNLMELFSRELRLNINLEAVSAYLQQRADGDWIVLEIERPDRDPDQEAFIEVKPGTISLSDAQLTLQPYDADGDVEPVTLEDINGEVNLSNVEVEEGGSGERLIFEAQQVDFSVEGASAAGGDLAVQGALVLPPAEDAEPISAPRSDRFWGQLRTQVEGLLPAAVAADADARGLSLNLSVLGDDLQAEEVVALAQSYLPELPLEVEQGRLGSNLQLSLAPDQPLEITGTARLQDGSLAAAALPAPVENLQAQARFQGRQMALEDVSAELGELSAQAQGTIDFRNGYDLTGQLDPFTVAQVSELFEFTLPVSAEGTYVADVAMTGPLADPQIRTELRSQDTITIDKVQLSRLQADLTFADNQLTIEDFQALPVSGGRLTGSGSYRLQPGILSLQAEGSGLNADALGAPYGLPENVRLGQVSLQAQVDGPPGDLQGQASWSAPTGDYPARGTVLLADNVVRFRDTFVQVAGGTVSGDGLIADGRWSANLQGRGIQLSEFTNADGVAAGRAQLSGSLDDFSLAGIRGQGDLQLALSGGSVSGQARLADGRWNADLRGQNLALNQFSRQLQGRAAGQFALSGSLDDFSLAGIRGQGSLELSDGLATAASYAPQLGAVRESLTASVAWDGETLQVQDARTAGIQASGVIIPDLSDGLGLGSVDLALRVRDYNLAALPLPNVVPVQGQASFQGRLSGSLDTLTLVGNAQVANLAVSDLAFDSPLVGPVRVALDEGVNVNLQGTDDEIRVAYGFDQRNLDFTIRADEALATGRTEGDIFRAQVANFPLEVLNLPPGGVPGLGTVSGTVESATITADLSRPTVVSQFSVVNPGLGYLQPGGSVIQADGVEQRRPSRFEGEFAYANGVATLTSGRLTTGESTYLVTARYSQQDPQIRGRVDVERGQLQDVLTTLQYFEIADLGRGLEAPEWSRRYSPEELNALLATVPTGSGQSSLLTQLRRLAEILQLQDQIVATEANATLPPLADLRGIFSGGIEFEGSSADDFNVAFDLEGRNWRWGDAYRANSVIAKGGLAEGVLQVDTLRFADVADRPNSFIDINGAIALDAEDISRSLTLQARNIPLEPLKRPLRMPDMVDLSGDLNANATFSGSLANPQARGIITLADVTLNQEPLQTAEAGFIYQNALLNFNSTVVVTDPEDPLTVNASIPYRLPFAQQPPPTDDFYVELDVYDQGLLLLNLLNNQVAIRSGSGEVQLRAEGKWFDGESVPDRQSLALFGYAEFSDVVLQARVLPDPLTNIDGRLSFQNDLIIVEELNGQFSDGQLAAQGTFPLLVPLDQRGPGAPPPDLPGAVPGTEGGPVDIARQPLTLDLSQIDLNFRGIYRGQVDGQVQLEGSALVFGPKLSGSVQLSQGRLSLPDSQVDGGDGGGTELAAASAGGVPVRFDDFAVSLNDNVRIQVGGIVDVAARGAITVDGIFPNLEPQGRVDLPSGRISLLTTDFRLRGNDNYAEFQPRLGLDPYLRATLQASIPDTRSSSGDLATSSPYPRNEVSDAPISRLGLNQSGIETVRIRAEVDGPASQVANLRGVTLRSTPARSENEIVSLISGGVLTALESTIGSVGGSGDNFGGLIALASAALLNQVQGLLGDSLNLSELRLYSVTPQSAQGGDSSVDIGGEIGFELSPTISMSVQKTFTNVTPFQFNLRYRISDQFTLRGTTSYEEFTENSGVLLEYESRF